MLAGRSPLSPGESYNNNDFRLDTLQAKHLSGKNLPTEAFVCKFTEAPTGKFFAFTGDTSFHPPIAEFVKGAPVFIHDACHSLAKEAADIAGMAKVGSLYLIHHPKEKEKEVLAEAKKVFPHSFLAKEGETVEV